MVGKKEQLKITGSNENKSSLFFYHFDHLLDEYSGYFLYKLVNFHNLFLPIESFFLLIQFFFLTIFGKILSYLIRTSIHYAL